MARPREFDELDALQKATKVFWTHGYNGSSLSDLTKAMGISKSSFYETFGNKHDLYLRTLDHYIENNGDKASAILTDDAPPMHLVDRWFQQAIDALLSGDIRRGCYLNNCAVEDGPHDPAVAEKVQSGLYDTQQKLAAVIACGQVSGEMNRNHAAESYASYLVNSMNGIMALGKCDPDRRELESIKAIVLGTLEPLPH